jgi:hypothetical protein
MSRQHISRLQRVRVSVKANHRCAYCHTAEQIVGPFLEIDHIIPESLGGANVDHNLTLACPLCNSRKSDRTYAPDPESGKLEPLFHPNEQDWNEHFCWGESGAIVVGRTPIGRATVACLDMNHPNVVATRQLWVMVGWHPPQGDEWESPKY